MPRRHMMVHPITIGVSSLRMKPFYTVASVELGNTTSKCILMTTNLQTAQIFQIDKEVRHTRDVRAPKEGEKIFGHTLTGVELTRESVSELVADVLTTVLTRSRVDIDNDLHFVVRSTGVTAGFASPEEVGAMVKALADGCLLAGVPPRKMTASISPDNLPPDLREFSWLKKVYFDGAVTSSLPPADAGVVANEMEGELVMAGLKGAAKNTDVDFRNPVMTLDFGTTLAGRITDDGHPYAKTIASFVGLAGAIPDALVRGSGRVDPTTGSALDLARSSRPFRGTIDEEWMQAAQSYIRVERVPAGVSRFGTVPVNVEAADRTGVVLVGVDVGVDGSDLPALERLGAEIVGKGGEAELHAVIDLIQFGIVQRILSKVESEGLILEDTSLGLTGRAITTGEKPNLITEGLLLADGSRWDESHNLLFVEDGLAMGAAVAARCMNSMGTRHNPMGGRKGDKCIMGARMRIQRVDKD
ncbi:MAG: methanogenesis marker 14 protein [Candidatus Thorarchaeota archaeon]